MKKITKKEYEKNKKIVEQYEISIKIVQQYEKENDYCKCDIPSNKVYGNFSDLENVRCFDCKKLYKTNDKS